MKRQRVNPSDYKHIIALYRAGGSPAVIGKLFNITRQWVRKIALKHDPLARHHRNLACQRLRLKNHTSRSPSTSSPGTLPTSSNGSQIATKQG